jgi:hypothetical protein
LQLARGEFWSAHRSARLLENVLIEYPGRLCRAKRSTP